MAGSEAYKVAPEKDDMSQETDAAVAAEQPLADAAVDAEAAPNAAETQEATSPSAEQEEGDQNSKKRARSLKALPWKKGLRAVCLGCLAVVGVAVLGGVVFGSSYASVLLLSDLDINSTTGVAEVRGGSLRVGTAKVVTTVDGAESLLRLPMADLAKLDIVTFQHLGSQLLFKVGSVVRLSADRLEITAQDQTELTVTPSILSYTRPFRLPQTVALRTEIGPDAARLQATLHATNWA